MDTGNITEMILKYQQTWKRYVCDHTRRNRDILLRYDYRQGKLLYYSSSVRKSTLKEKKTMQDCQVYVRQVTHFTFEIELNAGNIIEIRSYVLQNALLFCCKGQQVKVVY